MKKIHFLIGSLALTFVTALSAGVGFTFANYISTKMVGQQAGYRGKLDQMSIFFNANIWEKDNALFYLYDNTRGKWHSVTKTINPTIDGTTYSFHVFVLETPASTSNIVFVRVNPNGATVPTDGGNEAFGFSDNPKTVWNQTDNFTFSASYNYYVIPDGGWINGTFTHNNGEKNSKCRQNTLALNATENLYFAGSDSDVFSTN